MWEGFQPIVKSDHTQQKTHGIQTIRLREMWTGFPAKSGPTASRGNPAYRYHGEGSDIIHDVSVPHPCKMTKTTFFSLLLYCVFVNLLKT